MTATTTTLTGCLQGADLVLTAAVAPAGAGGTVTFAEGGTTVGTAPVAGGVAQVTVPSPASGSHVHGDLRAHRHRGVRRLLGLVRGLRVGLDSATGQLVLTVPAAPVVDGR